MPNATLMDAKRYIDGCQTLQVMDAKRYKLTISTVRMDAKRYKYEVW